ncbi:MAG: diaminopimelate dehydrogenase [Clostridiales bacterium]|jgi:diaminopimelate dehydrogenase|nr:diaminopimelate dehydrogenase [Clostridiales bacterium]
MQKIRIGILGYGNLGKGVEIGIAQNKDMELVGVFTKRTPDTVETVTKDTKVYHVDEAKNMTDIIDVMILCGGSKSDIPVQGPEFAAMFNTVDAYDTHAKIPEYFDAVNQVALQAKKTCVIATGFDPGLFSLNRLYGEAVLPEGKNYTFWGKGISQGHSDAIRRVDGVLDARQYTIPIKEALNKVREGEMPKLSTRQKHLRECFVVASEGADLSWIENEIKTMPDYFRDYDTVVHFISQEELDREHSKLFHGGFVFQSGRTGLNNENAHIIEYSLKLDSNPDFTANVLLAYARAVYRINREGSYGAKTVFDIAPAYLSIKSGEELRRTLL